jgi:hypothetical protein
MLAQAFKLGLTHFWIQICWIKNYLLMSDSNPDGTVSQLSVTEGQKSNFEVRNHSSVTFWFAFPQFFAEVWTCSCRAHFWEKNYKVANFKLRTPKNLIEDLSDRI